MMGSDGSIRTIIALGIRGSKTFTSRARETVARLLAATRRLCAAERADVPKCYFPSPAAKTAATSTMKPGNNRDAACCPGLNLPWTT